MESVKHETSNSRQGGTTQSNRDKKIKVWVSFLENSEAFLNVGEVPYEEYGNFSTTYAGEIDIETYNKNRMISRDKVSKLLTMSKSPYDVYHTNNLELEGKYRNKQSQCKKKYYVDLTKWIYFSHELNRALNENSCLICWENSKEIIKCGLCIPCYKELCYTDIYFTEFLDKLSEKIRVATVQLSLDSSRA